MSTKTTDEPKGAEVKVTVEDLAKSLAAVEGVKPKDEPAAVETVAVEPLAKSAATAISEAASEPLKKSLEASGALREIANLIGVHVDTSLETMQKSVQANADLNLGMIRGLEALRKSIDANTAAIEKFGELPATAPKSDAGAGAATEVLAKSTSAATSVAAKDSKQTRAQVLTGLETLAKSATNPAEVNEFTKATIKFETTGQITDSLLSKALKAGAAV